MSAARPSRWGVLLVALFLAGTATVAAAELWPSMQMDLPSGAAERLWRDALAKALKGQTEVVVEGGRIDVLTATQAIELDRPEKWHEGFGQALHYANLTGKKPVLALISYSQGPAGLTQKSRERFNLVQEQCAKQGVTLLVLFPSRPEEPHKTTTPGVSPPSPTTTTKEAGVHSPATAPTGTAETGYWLTKSSGKRHGRTCRYYQTTAGRFCSPTDGTPCKTCGG